MAELIFLIIGYRLGYFSEVKAKCKTNNTAESAIACYTNIYTKVKPKSHHARGRDHVPCTIFEYRDGQTPLK